MAAHGWWWNEGKWPIIRTMQVYVSFALYPKTCDVEPTPNVQHQKRRDRRHSRRVHRLHGGVPADSRVGLTASSVTSPHCVAHLCTCASGPQLGPMQCLGTRGAGAPTENKCDLGQPSGTRTLGPPATVPVVKLQQALVCSPVNTRKPLCLGIATRCTERLHASDHKRVLKAKLNF